MSSRPRLVGATADGTTYGEVEIPELLELVGDAGRESTVDLEALYPDDGWRNRDYARIDCQVLPGTLLSTIDNRPSMILVSTRRGA